MKLRRVCLLLCLMLVLLPSLTLSAAVFKNDEIGVELVIPDGWGTIEQENDQSFSAIFYPETYTGETIMFSYIDAWSLLSEEAKRGQKRSDINDLLTEDIIKGVIKGDDVENISTEKVIYKGIDYHKVTYASVILDTAYTNDSYFYVYNGYIYLYQYVYYSDGGEHAADFTRLMENIEYYELLSFTTDSGVEYESMLVPMFSSLPNMADKVDDSPEAAMNMINRYVAVILILYILPILFYRYIIRRKPVEKKKALRIVTIHCVIVLVGTRLASTLIDLGFIIYGFPLLWIFVNYLILTKGGDTTAQNNGSAVQGLQTYDFPGAQTDTPVLPPDSQSAMDSVAAHTDSLTSPPESVPANPTAGEAENATTPVSSSNQNPSD